jgi:hypothetical protein
MADPTPNQKPSIVPLFPDIPDIYADGFAVEFSAFTATLTLTLATQGIARPIANIRMSHAHAKVMAMLLRKFMKEVEEKELGEPIAVPSAALAQWKLSLDDDW